MVTNKHESGQLRPSPLRASMVNEDGKLGAGPLNTRCNSDNILSDCRIARDELDTGNSGAPSGTSNRYWNYGANLLAIVRFVVDPRVDRLTITNHGMVVDSIADEDEPKDFVISNASHRVSEGTILPVCSGRTVAQNKNKPNKNREQRSRAAKQKHKRRVKANVVPRPNYDVPTPLSNDEMVELKQGESHWYSDGGEDDVKTNGAGGPFSEAYADLLDWMEENDLVFAVNSVSVAHNRFTKDFDFYKSDVFNDGQYGPMFFMSGLFEFPDGNGGFLPAAFHHRLRPLYVDEDILLSTKCGTISVVRNVLAGELPPVLTEKQLDTNTDNEAKIRLIVRNLIPVVCARSRQFDFSHLRKMTKAKWKSMYKNYDTLEDDINKVVVDRQGNDWLFDAIEDYYQRIEDNSARILAAKEARYRANHGGRSHLPLRYGTYLFEYLKPVIKFATMSSLHYLCVKGLSVLGLSVPSVLSVPLAIYNVADFTLKMYSATGAAHHKYHDALDPKNDTPILAVCSSKTILRTEYSNHTRELPPIDPSVMLFVDDEAFEEDKEKTVPVYGPTISGSPEVVPSDSASCLYQAVAIRMAYARFTDANTCADFVEYAKDVMSRMPVFNLMFDDYVSESKAWLLKQYGQKRGAKLGELLLDDLTEEDYWSTIFVKAETYLGKTPVNFKSRMIWKRTDVVLARFSLFFHVLVHELKEYINSHWWLCYASGLTPIQLGDVVQLLSESFEYVAEGDGSNWDGSMNTHQHLVEQSFMRDNVETDVDLDWLMKSWTKVWGRSRDRSVKYKAHRGRRSGDLWTSGFNSLLNILMTAYSHGRVDPFEEPHLGIVVSGDDGIVFSHEDFKGDDIVNCYHRLGMKLDYVKRDSVDEVEFCSGYFWRVGGRLIYGNKPFRQLAKLGRDYYNHGTKMHKRLLAGTAKSLLSSMGHIPIAGAFLRMIADTADDEGVKAYYDRSLWNPYRITGGTSVYPELDTYNQFSEKYSISLQTIFDLEEMIETTLTIDDFPMTLVGDLFTDGLQCDLDKDIDYDNIYLNEVYRPEFTDDLEPGLLEDLLYAPIREEKQKLQYMLLGMTSNQASDMISEFEIQHGSPEYVRTLHRLFGCVTAWSFTGGVLLHSTWNTIAHVTNAALCNGKKKQGKAKKKGASKEKKELALWRKALGNMIKSGSTAIGAYFGGPMGAEAGNLIGSGISKITGMGDYTIKSNSLMQHNVTFGDGAITVAHREYIGGVYSSQNFTTVVYDINPGLYDTFPWLSILSRNYERYDIKGLGFEFVSTAGYLTTTQAQGVVVMATQYDPDASPFVNRREMESYLYTTSGIVTEPQLHLVECDPKDRPLEEMYIRYGDVDEERFTDLGRFTLAIEGSPADDVLLGELWVTYHVKLENPRLEAHGYGSASWAHIANGPYTNASPYGLLLLDNTGTLPVTVGGSGTYDTIFFPPTLDHGIYLMCHAWVGTGGVSLNYTLATTGITLLQTWELDQYSVVSNSGGNDGTYLICHVIQITDRSATFQLTSPIALPSSGTSIDVFIAQIGDPVLADFSAFSYEEALGLRGKRVVHPHNDIVPLSLNFGTPRTEIVDVDDEKHEYDDCSSTPSYDDYLTWAENVRK